MHISDSLYRGTGSLTREPFLFYEMRITARLLSQGFSDEDIAARIIAENLYQYPTERMIKGMVRACLTRLHSLPDYSLVEEIASGNSVFAKQISLYALMLQNKLVKDFMIQVIGEKYRTLDSSFSKSDLNAFFLLISEQDSSIAGWSESTLRKIKSILVHLLVENQYLDSTRSVKLNPILISPLLEKSIRNSNDTVSLPAFNCLS